MKKIFFLALTIFFMIGFLYAEFSDRILVKVNDEIILQSELDETIELIKAQFKMLGKSYNESELNSKTLNEMIEQKLIITMAKDEKIEVSDDAIYDRVNEFIDSLRSRFSSEEEFESALLKEGISYPDFRLKLESQVRDKLIYDKVKQKKQQEFISKAAVSDEDIRKYYEENKKNFKINDEMNLAQIFFDKSKGNPVELKKKAEEAVKKLMAGEDFNNLLNTLSQEDGIDGGAIGWVDTTQMDKKIRTSLLNVKKGKIVGPIETEDGFHIIKIIDLKKGKIQELSEIKEKIRIKIIEEKIEKMWNDWIAKVKQQAYIQKL